MGPGDPELLTVKAIRIIRACEVIAMAVSDPDFIEPVYEKGDRVAQQFGLQLENCVAYQIALQAVPEIAQKAKLFLPMPMRKDKNMLKQIHEDCTDAVAKILADGKDVACITLGDPTIYSTCLYVQKRLRQRGCHTELVPGVPSFCAAAARMNMGLVENRKELHVIPASYGVEAALELNGTKVLMKAGTKMPYVKQLVQEQGLDAKMIENCGMRGERIYKTVEEIPEDAGYYSVVIIKEKEKR